MSIITDTVVVQRGLKCPHCGTIGEVGDAACVNGNFDFPDNHPVVGVNAAGEVVEVDGAPPLTMSTPAARPAAPTPVVVAPAPTAVNPELTSPVVASAPTSKTCWLEVRVDLSPRDGRPPEGDADFDPAPTWSPVRFDLTAAAVRFGRFPILAGALMIEGDRAVSKVQGDLVRLDSGSYKVVHNGGSNGIFFPATTDAAGKTTRPPLYLEEGHEYILAPGDRFQMGDWIECEYHEQTA